ncbi:MAG: MerR family DNA-binding transcriptional regulator [Planctomycetes bacterium]|nr:MerR family DNA-binding transcriptional regulator [Planctomycetota bacterium]
MAAPKKLYKVGEIMRHTSLSRQTIHNYTMLGLIHADERTESGHRLYGEEVFDRIRKIEMLKRHRTLNEIRELLLAEDAAKPAAPDENKPAEEE